eukprot:352370-Hanusia_phi.AAC.2
MLDRALVMQQHRRIRKKEDSAAKELLPSFGMTTLVIELCELNDNYSSLSQHNFRYFQLPRVQSTVRLHPTGFDTCGFEISDSDRVHRNVQALKCEHRKTSMAIEAAVHTFKQGFVIC